MKLFENEGFTIVGSWAAVPNVAFKVFAYDDEAGETAALQFVKNNKCEADFGNLVYTIICPVDKVPRNSRQTEFELKLRKTS